MVRTPHFAVDDLSEEARRIARDGLDRGKREKLIIAEIEEKTGEKIVSSSFNRFACHYRVRLRRRRDVRERMEAAVETAVRMGAQVNAAVQAELLDALLDAAEDGKLQANKAGDAFLLGRLAIAFSDSERATRELKLKEQLAALKEREVKAAEAKLEAAMEKERRAEEALRDVEDKARKGVTLTPEKIAEIRETMYGIKPKTNAGN